MLADAPPWEDAAMDFAEAGLLEDLEGPEREAREALLERLDAEGVSLQEMLDAVREDRLALLLVERRLGGRYTAAQISEKSGVPLDTLIRLRRLVGLPEPDADEAAFGEEDVAQAKSTKLFLDAGISLEDLSDLARVLGESMSRLAASVSGVFGETFLQPGDTERDVAERFAALAEQLQPAFAPVLVATFNAHLRESVHRGMISQAEREAGRLGTTQEMAVCFADLVGFTRLGHRVEGHELGTVAGRLAGLAGDLADGPVRLVKTIGDAVMFVSPQPTALVESALRLVDAAEEAELPSLRAGVACGPTVQRAGDFFGHSVNLASRVTGMARPGSVLCTEEVRDAAPDDFAWSYAGRFKLKGIAHTIALHRPRLRDAA